MKIKVAFFLLFAPAIAHGQRKCDCFDRLHNLSYVYYFEKDWPKTVDVLKDAISYLDQDHAGSYFDELASDYAHFNEDSAIMYFTKAIRQGYPATWVQQAYPAIYNKMDTATIRLYTFENRDKMDFDLYDKFVTALDNDQFVRNEAFFSRANTFYGPLDIKNFIDTLYKKVDSSTFEFVKEILNKYGFPTEHLLGFYPSGFIVFILHLTAVNDENSRYILGKLEELNETCALPNKSLILALKDRQALYTTGKNFCGLMGYQRYLHIKDVTKADSFRLVYNQIRLKEELSGTDSASINSLTKLKARGYKPLAYPKDYFCNAKYDFN